MWAPCLRYVTDYITKCSDSFTAASLYSNYIVPYVAAYRFLQEMTPNEPEMWHSLSNTKSACTPNGTKKFVPPMSDDQECSTTVTKYRERSHDDHHLSLLQWLRLYNDQKTPPSRYRGRPALVGVKWRSVFSESFLCAECQSEEIHPSAGKRRE